MKRAIMVAISVILALCLCAPIAVAQSTNSADKLTTGELGAEWWQWVLSKPTKVNPMNGNYTGGAQCSGEAVKGVWFLAGSFSNIAQGGQAVERTCTAPAGTSIFFPVINVECSVVEGDGTNEAELRACATGIMDDVDANTGSITAAVDGNDVLADHSSRADTPLFTWVIPRDNVFNSLLGRNLPPGPSDSVADGRWVELPPLSKGEHDIEFGGSFYEGDLIQENTYHLTVK